MKRSKNNNKNEYKGEWVDVSEIEINDVVDYLYNRAIVTDIVSGFSKQNAGIQTSLSFTTAMNQSIKARNKSFNDQYGINVSEQNINVPAPASNPYSLEKEYVVTFYFNNHQKHYISFLGSQKVYRYNLKKKTILQKVKAYYTQFLNLFKH